MPRSRRLRSVPVLAAALASLSACGSPPAATHPGAEPKAPAASAPANPAPAGTAAGGPGAALLAEVVPYPSDARPWEADRTGLLSLKKFVDNFYAESDWTSQSGLMSQRGFVQAARHGWINSDGSQDDVWLVEFGSGSGAKSMYLSLTNSWKTRSRSATNFTDPAARGEGQYTTALDGQGDASAKVTAVSGHLVVYVKVYTAGRPSKGDVLDLMNRQLSLLG